MYTLAKIFTKLPAWVWGFLFGILCAMCYYNGLDPWIAWPALIIGSFSIGWVHGDVCAWLRREECRRRYPDNVI